MNLSLGMTSKKTILIAGSQGLLGKYLTEKLSKDNEIICLDILKKDKISKKKVTFYKVDVSDFNKLNRVKIKILKKFKKIDAIINCTIKQNFNQFESQKSESFEKCLKVNVLSIFNTTKIFLSMLKKSKNPSIINFGSIYGMVSGDPKIYVNKKRFTSDVYGASKAAIIQLTKYYSVHLREYNIRVNCVSPGGVKDKQSKKFIKNYSNKVPIGRMADKNEIYESVLFLLNDKSEYVNGHNLVIDGGYTIL